MRIITIAGATAAAISLTALAILGAILWATPAQADICYWC